MVKNIVHDPFFLGQKSEKATKEDLAAAKDLLDTLVFNRVGCVGLAANMIGVKKRIIACDNNGSYAVMFNPEIIKRSGEYEAEEGCLSLSGVRKTKRFQFITVRYQDEKMLQKEQGFFGWTAQIIQHEIDHCNGILI